MLRDLQSGLGEVALYDRPGAVLDRVRAARGSRERRLSVYRTNTLNSLTDVLSAAYPVIRRIVGDRFFRGAARAFVESAPPVEPVLYRYGGDFQAFLAAFAPAADLPYLPAVARLEWARIAAYFAADMPPLDPQRLAAVPPEALETVTFAAHPSVTVLDEAHPVFEIWRVNQPDIETVPPVDLTAPERGIVFRRGLDVTQRPLDAPSAAWLAALTAGQPLADATAAASDRGPLDIQDVLRQALADGIFTGITV
jgi:hypothetical protein